MALNKNLISENNKSAPRVKTNSKAEVEERNAIGNSKTSMNCIRQVEDESEDFQEHIRNMRAFSKSHE